MDATELHKHLEIEQSDTFLTFSAFDVPATKQIELSICRTDKLEQLKFNSYQMFLNETDFLKFAEYVDEIRNQLVTR